MRSQTLGFLALDSFFRVKVLRVFYPSLIHLLLIPVPNDTLGTPNMASKISELSVNLNVPFTIFAKQMNYFCPKYMSIIFRHSSPICSDSQGHFDPPEVKNVQNIPCPQRHVFAEDSPRSLPEAFALGAPQAAASVKASSTRRPHAATSGRCWTSSVWLRREWTREIRQEVAGGLKKMG